MYGGKRPYGYAHGGSGGGIRTIGSIENTRGVWDGVVPYVIGSTMAIPNMFTVRMQALRVLRDRFPQIVDAMEPGGSGDPCAGLNAHEASVLREVEQMGFPMETWFGYKTMGLHGFAALYGGVAAADPTYFTDFWTKPGYLGHDRPELFTDDRIHFKGTVAEVITAEQAARLGLSTDPFAQEGHRAGASSLTARGRRQIVALPFGEEGGPRLVAASPAFSLLGASLSPDGRWLAYADAPTGRREIWVRPFAGGGPPVRVSAEGGEEPLWARDGRALFYRQGTRLLSAMVGPGDDLHFEAPVALFESNHLRNGLSPTYDVAADGRFLMLEPADANPAAARAVVITNWLAELGRRSAAAP